MLLKKDVVRTRALGERCPPAVTHMVPGLCLGDHRTAHATHGPVPREPRFDPRRPVSALMCSEAINSSYTLCLKFKHRSLIFSERIYLKAQHPRSRSFFIWVLETQVCSLCSPKGCVCCASVTSLLCKKFSTFRLKSNEVIGPRSHNRLVTEGQQETRPPRLHLVPILESQQRPSGKFRLSLF